MFLSIIIPTYNRSVFLFRTLSSLQAQLDQDFEVYIIDDGSTDSTCETVKPFLGSRYHYVYQVNSERAAARNNGIALATSQYVYFLDSDDLLLPNHVSLFKLTAHQHGLPPIVAAQSSFVSSNAHWNNSVDGTKIILSPTILLYGNQFSCNYGVRVDSLRHLFVEDTSLVAMEDWIFLFENTFPDQYIHLMPQATVLMSDHAERSMHQHKSVISARKLATNYLLSHFRFDDQQKSILISNSTLFVAVHQRLAGLYADSVLSLSQVDLLALNLLQLKTFVFTLLRSFACLILDRSRKDY
jgi:glycosyltransferase involved in cell wall biosynthesis